MDADDEVMTLGQFRKRFRLCPKGHRESLNGTCLPCKDAKRRDECPHDGPRYWRNPSNLPGDDRFVCSACGKAGLPEPTT